jgi:predicted MFS family arabinose efflux permease
MSTRRLAVLLHALFFVAAATQNAIVPLLPRLSHAYGLSPASGALLLAAPGLATLAVSLPAGVLADQLGARRVTVFATAVMAGAGIIQAAPSYAALLAGRLTFGVAYGILWTTGVAWLSRAGEEGGSPHLGAVATSAAVGMVAGPALGGVVADTMGLSAPFLIVGAFAAVLAVLLLFEPPVSASAAGARDSMRALIRVAPSRPAVTGGACALAIAGAVSGVTQLLIPLQLHQLGFSASATGVAFSAAAGVYIAVSAVVVRFGHRATTLRVTALAALALSVALIPALLGNGATLLVLVLVTATAPRAVVSTVAYPLATSAEDLGDGLVIGLLNGTWALGLVIAPLLAGAVDQIAGPGPAYLTAILPGALASGWLLLRRPRLQPRATLKLV